jgi:hypothetical protein
VWTLDTKGDARPGLAVLRTRRAVRAFRPDIVPHAPLRREHRRPPRAGGGPCSPTLHNPDYGAEDNGTLRFKLRKLVDSKTGDRYNRAFVAVSDAVRLDYVEQTGFAPIYVVPNYVDVGEIARRVAGVDRRHERVMLGVSEEVVCCTSAASTGRRLRTCCCTRSTRRGARSRAPARARG